MNIQKIDPSTLPVAWYIFDNFPVKARVIGQIGKWISLIDEDCENNGYQGVDIFGVHFSGVFETESEALAAAIEQVNDQIRQAIDDWAELKLLQLASGEEKP